MAKRMVKSQEELRAEFEAARARSLAEEAAMDAEIAAHIEAEMRGEFSAPVAGLDEEEVDADEIEAGKLERPRDLGTIAFFRDFQF